MEFGGESGTGLGTQPARVFDDLRTAFHDSLKRVNDGGFDAMEQLELMQSFEEFYNELATMHHALILGAEQQNLPGR